MRLFCFVVFIGCGFQASSQLSPDSISEMEAAHIINYLAADSLKGRGNYTPELHKAANYIANRFENAGLKTFPSFDSYFQPLGKDSSKALKEFNGNYIAGNVLLNVIGVLEGRSKASQVIIFSAHYDHVGTEQGAIYNGANDNASGTTALLLLADYYAKRQDNERTIIFCAFAGEELGLHGSTLFAEYLKADFIVAMINIEMIGISSVGKNSFFITGANHSNLKKIFEKNLLGRYKIKGEPSYTKTLFNRSDNFPFARKGVPAHKIMASDDDDRCYHAPCDDVNRIDVKNMTNIIRAIAIGSESLVSGEDTPSRIKSERLD